jgi:uncharacterized protein involved in response to NO
MNHVTRPDVTIFTYGFRPFFLAAGVWAALAIAIWIAVLQTGISLPSRFDPLTWHIHEMLFGFVMAAIAGFLLTAIANWTGRPPVQGALLAGLAFFWLAGRAACLLSAYLSPWQVLAADLSFPLVFLGVIARELLAARNWRNVPLLAPVLIVSAANLLMHLEAYGYDIPAGLGWRFAVCAIVILISVIAGRIVPTFTRNWLNQRKSAALPRTGQAVNRAALVLLHTGLLAWVVFPETDYVGGLLIAAGVANLWRLWQWRGDLITAEPLLLVLHIGYAWLVLGVVLLGLSVLWIAVPQTAAIHALTVGAMSTMILAVMTRATRGHTGHPLAADRATAAIYVLIVCAALGRVVAAFGLWTNALLVVSALFWIAAFGVFSLHYGRMLTRPRIGT